MSRFQSDRMAGFDAYVPGEQPKDTSLIKLNTNESPYPPSPRVAQEVNKAVCDGLNRYSDLNCVALGESFSARYKVSRDRIMFTNGSDEALYYCFLAFCGDKVGAAFPDISYGFYPVYADMCGIAKKVIPLDSELRIDPNNYVNLNSTVVIANPNAPTGRVLPVSGVEKILRNNMNNVVIVDEAYADFSGSSCISLADRYENLVIVGTFSKSRHLAGARLGYVIARPELIADLEKVKFSVNPYNVNSLTQAAGKAALDDDGYYKEKNAEIASLRDSFSEELGSIGFDVLPSGANFVFAEYKGVSGELLLGELRKRGILVRRFAGERIKNRLRITIGTKEQMAKVFSALKEIIGGMK